MSVLSRRWQAFTASRSPRRDSQTLTQRNLYIVPSRGGWGFTVVVLILLLAAINEQLNLGYALAFLLGGVGLSAMSRTHGNLRSLALTLGQVTPVHAGQPLSLPVLVDATQRRLGAWGLMLNTEGQPMAWGDVESGQQQTVMLSLPAPARGWLTLPRIRIQSRYPLGLFTVWGYWRPAQRVLVWPSLEEPPPPLPTHDTGDGEPAVAVGTQTDEAEQLREWRRGDNLRQIAWKKSATRMASGLSPVSREGGSRVRRERWLTWDDTTGLALEARLSRLAAWLVMAERDAQQDGRAYGLKMPGHEIACGLGAAHLKTCLDLLAGWGQPA